MNKPKFILCVAMLAVAILPAGSQNNTNSPYTRHGYGALADRSFAGQRGMGGIGYGLRNRMMINPLNPASYSAVDSLTFMFEAGLGGQYSWFDENGKKASGLNGNLEYLAMQFRLLPDLGIGVGLEPVSYVGYEYGDTSRLTEGSQELYTKSYEGNGGLNRIYGTVSYKFLDRLSLGVKFAYLYGDVFHNLVFNNTTSGANNTAHSDTLRASGLTLDFGLQYSMPVGKNNILTLGAVYTPKTGFNGAHKYGEYSVNNSTGRVVIDSLYSANKRVQMPESYGFGFTFVRVNKYTVGADVLYQKWGDVRFYDDNARLNNSLKINAGGEFIPNIMNNRFLNRVRYRAGVSYSGSYFKINNASTGYKDAGYSEYGLNVGFGFPMVDRRSFINVAFEYSRTVPEVKQLLSEQHIKLTVGYTFNEMWFYKQKLK
jgi:hypothetical protein